MEQIEPREVSVIVKDFEMKGIIAGGINSFTYQSSNTYFTHYFPSGEIDSLNIDKNKLTSEQLQIVEACENKIRELLGIKPYIK